MDLELDHVLLAVADLDQAAARLGTHPGLTALPGGRHPGAGTANMIVPLGRDYLELIAIVDEEEAAHLPRSGRVREAVEKGRTFAGWALRSADLERLRDDLERVGIATRGPFEGRRLRPDGVVLEWRTLELSDPAPADPFFIEWNLPEGAHPAQQPVAHRSRASGIAKVTAGSGGRVIELLREARIPVEVAAGRGPGLVAIELVTPAGPVLIR